MGGKAAPSAKARKAAQETDQKQAVAKQAEDEDWGKGAKDNSKAVKAKEKAEEAQRKKEEKERLRAEEEASLPSKKASSSKSAPPKKSRGIDLAELDDKSTDRTSARLPDLEATGIDNALDALNLTSGQDSTKVDKHPERRFKAAYKAYEEKRLTDPEYDGLRDNQKKERIRKEFEKAAENPFNATNARYDASKQEVAEIKAKNRERVEILLTSKT